MSELRHDFRRYYGVSYEDVPTEEAVSLVRSLPRGSRYAASVEGAFGWSDEQNMIADVIDILLVINWRLMGCPEDGKPDPVARPGDAERRRRKRAAVASARERIESTEWEEV